MSYKKTSLVWDSFKKTSTGIAQCQVNGCAENISNKGGNTTTMKKHLEKIHNISTQKKRPADEDLEDPQPAKKASGPAMFSFVSRESLHEIISKCAAKDGISFSTIVKSEAIQGYVKSRNYKMPSSASTVQKLVAEFFEEKKAETKKNIEAKLSRGEKFTITADEWTDIVLRRYLNVTLHSAHEQVVLGLVPIVESCTSEKTEELVFLRLQEFGVDFTKDIVASTHDGASVMVKYGRIISAESQCCYNHAIHLSVVETFYQKKSFDTEDTTAWSEDDTEEEEMNDNPENGDIIFESESDIPEIRSEYKAALDEMRRIIRFFRKSSVRTEILLKHVKAKEGKPLRLLLDVKTRWSSLVTSINRFVRLIDSVNVSLEELGLEPYTECHLNILKEIVMILEPVKVGVNELSKQGTNLLMAEATLIYIFHQLKSINSPLSLEFQKSLKTRIDQRRNKDLVSVLMLLHHGVYPKANDYFSYSSKASIKATATSLMNRLYPCDITEVENSEDDSEDVEEENEYSKLQKCIASFTKTQTASTTGQHLSIDKEFKLLEANNGKRTERLEKLYQALLTVKPTSTASERVFSVAGIFITKLRNRMSSSTLNALVFLKYYFLNKNV